MPNGPPSPWSRVSVAYRCFTLFKYVITANVSSSAANTRPSRPSTPSRAAGCRARCTMWVYTRSDPPEPQSLAISRASRRPPSARHHPLAIASAPPCVCARQGCTARASTSSGVRPVVAASAIAPASAIRCCCPLQLPVAALLRALQMERRRVLTHFAEADLLTRLRVEDGWVAVLIRAVLALPHGRCRARPRGVGLRGGVWPRRARSRRRQTARCSNSGWAHRPDWWTGGLHRWRHAAHRRMRWRGSVRCRWREAHGWALRRWRLTVHRDCLAFEGGNPAVLILELSPHRLTTRLQTLVLGGEVGVVRLRAGAKRAEGERVRGGGDGHRRPGITSWQERRRLREAKQAAQAGGAGCRV